MGIGLIIGSGTTNYHKREAVKIATKKVFSPEAYEFGFPYYETESRIEKMPLSKERIILGAKNRARSVFGRDRFHHYSIGMEGGITKEDELISCSYLINHKGIEKYSFSSPMSLPNWMLEKIRSGKELNEILEEEGITTRDTTAWLTGGVLTRVDEFLNPLIKVLSSFVTEPYKRE